MSSRAFFSGRLYRVGARETRCYWDTCGVPLFPPSSGCAVCVLCTQRKDRAGDNDHTLDCARCGKIVRVSAMSDTHHEGLCQLCWDSTGCEDCVPINGRVRAATTRRDGKYVCFHCSLKRLFKCKECGALDARHMRNVGYDYIYVCAACSVKPPLAPWRVAAEKHKAEHQRVLELSEADWHAETRTRIADLKASGEDILPLLRELQVVKRTRDWFASQL